MQAPSAVAAAASSCAVGRGQRLAVDDADHLIDAGVDAAGEIALLEQRHDGVVDDAARSRIGERAFEAVAAPRCACARSFFATISIAPSSTALAAELPGFDEADRRTARCLRAGCVGTISTAICAPLRASNAASFSSSADCCAAVSVPVRSVTRASSFGSGICAPQRQRAARRATRAQRDASARLAGVTVSSLARAAGVGGLSAAGCGGRRRRARCRRSTVGGAWRSRLRSPR